MEPAARAPAPSDPDWDWDWAGLRATAGREARRVLADRHDAEDAVQEALLRAWRQRARCRSPQSPDAWLRQIARNEAVRLRGRISARAAEALSDELPGKGSAGERAIDRVFVEQALARLRDEDDRRLVMMRYELDLPDAVIARSLGIAESTVRVRVHRLKSRLRVLMGGTST